MMFGTDTEILLLLSLISCDHIP